MPKPKPEVKAEKIRIATQMRADDLGWDMIARDPRIDMPVETLRKWIDGSDGEGRTARRQKRGAKADDAAVIKELRAENARLQALVSDILLGKVSLERRS